jgi:hypothetical protein
MVNGMDKTTANTADYDRKSAKPAVGLQGKLALPQELICFPMRFFFE